MSRRKAIAVVLLGFAVAAAAQAGRTRVKAETQEIERISADELAGVLATRGGKPLVLQVGPARLFRLGHIRGAEYAGPASETAGIEALRKRVQPLPRTQAIVIYCGCCPWEHCPNIKPAYEELRQLGFRNVKALYLPNNFKFDWEDKGYPTEKAVASH